MKTDKNSRTQSTSGTDTHPEQAFPSLEPLDAPECEREEISYEEWLAKYRPIKNPSAETTLFTGRMFETDGKDLEFVKAQPWRKVWSIVDYDGENWICEGSFYEERIGYFITETERPADRYFAIKL